MAPRLGKIILRRAFEEARYALKIETRERAMIAVAAIVGVSIIWLIGWRVPASIVIILFFPFIWIWKLLTIPEKLGQIVIGTGKPYATVEPSGINRTRIVRVMLKNNTCTEISRGKLYLLNLNPPNDTYEKFLLEDRITIGPHKNIFIDIAAYNEGTSEALVGSWIQLIIPHPGGYFMPATFGLLPVRSHTFHLKFSSLADDIFDETYCRIFVDSNHVLQLEEWS